MPRIKKKGTAGAAKNYITRTQAVRKLQISLPDFRRLCIFKGIYPREPRSKKKAAKNSTPSTTFYYAKDIQYLLHEPLLAKFRDHKALAKKITRALGRNEVGDAQRLEKNHAPKLSLDHIIKERYPTFVDALRDLDDALSMLFLFANLPQTEAVPPKTIALCKRLTHEFEHFLIRSHALRKSFLSIKGIYYQATVQGQDILWLVPYNFVQRVSDDIDFRVMGTFVDFYTTLLGFVNYRLYTSIGLVYPPVFDAKSDEQGGELGAFTIQGRSVTEQNAIENEQSTDDGVQTSEKAQLAADELKGDRDEDAVEQTDDASAEHSTEIDTFPAPIDPESDVLAAPSISTDMAASLFKPFVFYLSRETPRHPLEFVLRAFGCRRVGWPATLGDGAYTTDESDRRITHQVVDRPNLPLPPIPDDEETTSSLRPGERVAGRSYIQPQWVWDCINAGKLLRPDLYAPGAVLPPHLSPWVKPTKGEYDPTKSVAEQEAEDEAEAVNAGDDVDVKDTAAATSAVKTNGKAGKVVKEDDSVAEGMDVELAESDDSASDEEEWGGLDEPAETNEAESPIEDDDDDDDETREARQHQREVEAEARGAAVPTKKTDKSSQSKQASLDARKRIDKRTREQNEELDRQKMMMSRKKRQLFEKMQYSNSKRDTEAEKLRAKRRKIEAGRTAA